MDLKQLYYYTAIVDEGSISAAAKKLHISQPPLSNQMKALESELGVVLFERGIRSITLTLCIPKHHLRRLRLRLCLVVISRKLLLDVGY